MSEYLLDGDVMLLGARPSATPKIGKRELKVIAEFDPPPDFRGAGSLSGSWPDGTVTVDGAPTAAEIRILWRDPAGSKFDGYVVARTMSAPNGTWMVTGLNPDLRYDVVGRKSGHNDVIMANVSPEVE